MNSWIVVAIGIVNLVWTIGLTIVSRAWKGIDDRLKKIESSVELARVRSSEKSGEQNKVLASLQVDMRVIQTKMDQSRDDRIELRQDIKDLREDFQERRLGEDRRKP